MGAIEDIAPDSISRQKRTFCNVAKEFQDREVVELMVQNDKARDEVSKANMGEGTDPDSQVFPRRDLIIYLLSGRGSHETSASYSD